MEETPNDRSNDGIQVAPGPFKSAFMDIVEEVVTLSNHVTNIFTGFKSTLKQTDNEIEELQVWFQE